MNDPSPELEQQVRDSFARLEPEQVFCGCKIAETPEEVIVRIYSQGKGYTKIMPTPYQVYRFEPSTGNLRALSDEEAAPYVIQNYK
jgi:hypothetical protein